MNYLQKRNNSKFKNIMGCCGAGSHESKQNNNFPQNNNSSAVEKSGDSVSLVKNIFTWGLVIVVIIALLAWLF